MAEGERGSIPPPMPGIPPVNGQSLSRDSAAEYEYRMKKLSHTHGATSTAELRKVVLGNLVLLVLVGPLVKVGLEEVRLLGVLEKPRPVLLLELLLLQLYLNVLGGLVDLALGGVDLGVEIEVNMKLALESCRGAGKAEACWLQVKLGVLLGNIGD